MKVYLAGKITKNGWRSEIFAGYRSYDPQVQESDEVDGFVATGAFFVGCDHGCFHGDNSHGVAAYGWRGRDSESYTCEMDLVESPENTVAICRNAIDRSDVIFAWIDSVEVYGTLVEIGYAIGKGIPVYLFYSTDNPKSKDMWFAGKIANYYGYADTIEKAWEMFKLKVRAEL